MGVSTAVMGARHALSGQGTSWLRTRNWDLLYVSLSVILVPLPYLLYVAIRDWQILLPLATSFETSIQDVSRQIINAVVALAIGGPHMYATFARTSLDKAFVQRFRVFSWSSLIIPAVVIALAFANIAALIAVFFFWASLHLLHQIIFIVECYNVRQKTTLSLQSKAIDYAVVLTSLYPIALFRMWRDTFTLGPFNVGQAVGSVTAAIIPGVDGFPLAFVILGGLAFGISLVLFTAKSIIEIRGGYAHLPKILFIYVTIIASFLAPLLPNLDTAFQGMNVWHSFQYLALTWYINNLRQERGELKKSRLVERMSQDGKMREFYLFNVGLTILDMLLAAVIFLLLRATGMPGTLAFEKAYYIAILSFLWIHYYHDHFLFTQPQAVEMAPAPATG